MKTHQNGQVHVGVWREAGRGEWGRGWAEPGADGVGRKTGQALEGDGLVTNSFISAVPRLP